MEIGVVVKNDQALGLAGCRDQEVGDLAATLMLGGQDRCTRLARRTSSAAVLDQLEEFQRFHKPVPFGGAACRNQTSRLLIPARDRGAMNASSPDVEVAP